MGWYLLLPPLLPGAWEHPPLGAAIDFTKPLAKWDQAGSFDSDAACEEGRDKFVNNVSQALDHSRDELQRLQLLMQVGQLLQSWCIASDDPRLKPK